MKKVYYEKQGRRYVPVAEYDSDFLDRWSEGSTLITCRPGVSTRRYNIDPNYAALIAASIVAEDAIVNAISEKSKMRIHNRQASELTEEQLEAWRKFSESMGVKSYPLEYASYSEVAAAGAAALIKEADKLLNNEAVRKAYENFMLVVKLSQEHKTKDKI